MLIRHHVNAFFSSAGAASFVEAANRRCRIAMAISLHQGNNTVPARRAHFAAGPVAVGRFIAPIAGKTLSRGGPVMAGLLSQWPAISGPALAAYTVPAKLTKGAPEPDFPEKTPPSAASEGGPGQSARSAIRRSRSSSSASTRRSATRPWPASASFRRPSSAASGPLPRNRHKPASPAPAPEAPQPTDKLAAALARMAAGVKARQANCQ